MPCGIKDLTAYASLVFNAFSERYNNNFISNLTRKHSKKEGKGILFLWNNISACC